MFQVVGASVEGCSWCGDVGRDDLPGGTSKTSRRPIWAAQRSWSSLPSPCTCQILTVVRHWAKYFTCTTPQRPHLSSVKSKLLMGKLSQVKHFNVLSKVIDLEVAKPGLANTLVGLQSPRSTYSLPSRWAWVSGAEVALCQHWPTHPVTSRPGWEHLLSGRTREKPRDHWKEQLPYLTASSFFSPSQNL